MNNRTKVMITKDTTTSTFKVGQHGYVDGYCSSKTFDTIYAIVVMEKDGSFHKVPLEFLITVNEIDK